MKFDNLHQILRSLYEQMMPLCGDMAGVAKGIKPGFETKEHLLNSHDICELIPIADYRTINALPRFKTPASFATVLFIRPLFAKFVNDCKLKKIFT